MAAELAVFPELLFAHPSRAQWGEEGESQGAKDALFERMYKADPDLFTMDRSDTRSFEAALNKVLNTTLKMDNLVTLAAPTVVPPRCVRLWPERAAFDVRTAVCRRVCRPPPAGRSSRTHCRAVWLTETLDVFWSACNVKRYKRVHPGLDPPCNMHSTWT